MAEKKKVSNLQYEEAYAELLKVIEELETGTLKLEEMIEKFARGKELLIHCQDLLENAELIITELQVKKSLE